MRNALVLAATAVLLCVGCEANSEEKKASACQDLLNLLPTIERTCLSNSSQEYATTLHGAVDLLKRSIDAKVALSAEQVHGARTNLEAQYQKPENDAIRECMRVYQSRLFECLDRQASVSLREQTTPFEVVGAYTAVGCNESAQSAVEHAIPADAYEVQKRCDWIETVDVSGQPCEATVKGTVAQATGSIIGRNKDWTGNCPGGGHGRLKLSGSYKQKVPK